MRMPRVYNEVAITKIYILGDKSVCHCRTVRQITFAFSKITIALYQLPCISISIIN